ncbi:CoA ester lyase [Ensifer sp. Root127]|uniref:HpcH/HpaI aldolase/citrate lyase family protein n=1 Tax=Ensifer sp. Root127 TaxID=1736440 RepID=UPI00070B547C|nr:CoA ester lyase [Ensifer sp. Root127]KQW72414.1 aldolase [Ensifer sp. Root127]
MVDFRPPIAPIFVPASRPDRFGKASQSGADAVIVDLEDAVMPAHKEAARGNLVLHSAALPSDVIIRINAAGTPWHDDDLSAVARLPNIRIMLPKAERRQDVENVVRRVGQNVAIFVLIETAAGLAQLQDLLSADRVLMAAFGSIDFSLDVGSTHERLPLLAARSELVWRSRAAQLHAPLDGVTADLKNSEATSDDASHAAALGFGGKLAIHPAQIEPIKAAFRPDAETIAWARNVISKTASSDAASQVDGEMVDRPVIERARLVLNRANSGRE